MSYPQPQYGGQARPAFASNANQAYQTGHSRPQQPAQTQRGAMPMQTPQTIQQAERRRVNSVNLPDGDQQYRQAKKRKAATDKSLPTFAPSSSSAITLPASVEAKNATLASLSSSYSELQRLERKLDWTLARKRVEYADTTGSSAAGGHIRPSRIRKKLRVTVSNTCANQLWQGAASNDNAVDFGTGEGVPSWTLRVEGALVDLDESMQQSGQYRFTRVVDRVIVDAARSDMVDTSRVHAEWDRKQDASTIAQDGLTFDGRGSSNITVQISLFLNHYPERYAINPDLGGPLGIIEASRIDLLGALWTYIRKNNLLDPDDRKIIRCDAFLAKLYLAGHRAPAPQQDVRMPIGALADIMARHAGRLPPVKLDYTIKLDGDPASSALCWDLDIDVADPVRDDMKAFVDSMDQQSKSTALIEQLSKLDDVIGDSASKVRTIKSRRDALAAFSADPVSFLRVWLASQSADIDMLLSGADRSHQALSGATAEDLRHADFYRAPWLKDAINLHQGRLFGQKVHEAAMAGSAQARR